MAKRKRGRPALFDPETMDAARKAFGGLTTDRGRQDRYYAYVAHNALGEHAATDFPWLCGDALKIRWSVLAQLGRLGDEHTIRKCAKSICEAKVTARDAVRIIRKWRTGKFAKGDAVKLAAMVCRTVDEYRKNHDCDMGTILAAMDLAVDACQEVADAE